MAAVREATAAPPPRISFDRWAQRKQGQAGRARVDRLMVTDSARAVVDLIVVDQ
jgi:hypothetical protein